MYIYIYICVCTFFRVCVHKCVQKERESFVCVCVEERCGSQRLPHPPCPSTFFFASFDSRGGVRALVPILSADIPRDNVYTRAILSSPRSIPFFFFFSYFSFFFLFLVFIVGQRRSMRASTKIHRRINFNDEITYALKLLFSRASK